MKVNNTLLSFNRGLISRLALARIDLPRTALSAETMVNWMPRVLGSMQIRPGLRFLHSTKNNAAAVHIPFVFSSDDTAIIELTNGLMRVIVGDVLVTRPAVTTTITNGTFDTDLSGWTDNDESGASSVWASAGGFEYMSLTGTGVNFAIRDQQVTVSGANIGVEHALSIHILRGPVTLSVGSTLGGGEYVNRITLRTGYHSIAFTPTGDFHLRLSALTQYSVAIDSIAVASAGTLELTTPWLAADLPNVRYDQSGDVIFLADGVHRQQRIERQNSRSWAVVEYLAPDGPFLPENLTPTTLTSSALTGSTTLTASKPLFTSSNVGSLFRLASNGQKVSASITGADQFTEAIRVTGIENGRTFQISLTGTWVANVSLQRSVGAEGDWTDVAVFTTNTSTVYDDDLDNQIIFYRLGVTTGNYTSGTVVAQLSYAAGSLQGVGLVVAYTSSTVVTAVILDSIGSTTATSSWWEGAWSDRRGWPSAVGFFDGRLWWSGKDRIDGSVSDAFDSFDDNVEGDSGPINRSVGSGPVDTINWLLPLNQLFLGTEGAELHAKSSSFDEPLTPTAFSLKPISTQGSARIKAEKIDNSGLYVQRGGNKIYEIDYDPAKYSYFSKDLTAIIPEIGSPGITRMAVQRQIDTRIHCVRSDGKVAILIFDSAENVTCWVLFDNGDSVEDVLVLPGTVEDSVYYLVNRTIGGVTKRYLEKWELESLTHGGADNRLADSAVIYNGAVTLTITGLSHLEGRTVCVWGNSKDLGTYTVSSGSITLSEAVTQAYVGLSYTATFKSAKLAVASQSQAPLTQRKRIDHLGLILADTHAQGLTYGQEEAYMDSLPLIEDGAPIDTNAVSTSYDADSVELNGTWDTDARLWLKATAPRSCTVLACVIAMSGHDKG